MQKFFAIGNLTRDPELAETTNGISVCHFTIAVNRSYANGDGDRQTDFFNVTAWRGTAENVAKFCRKGSKVAVFGTIQMRNYEDSKGIPRTTVDVIAQDVEFLSSNQKANAEPAGVFDQSSTPGRRTQLSLLGDDEDTPF